MKTGLVALLLAGAADAQEENPVLVTFVVHLDPIAGPGIEKRYAEERDNLQWLVEFVADLPPERAPRVLLEFGGDHADYYRKDPSGLALLRKARASGLFTFGVHFHTQVRERDGSWRLAPKETRRRVTEDNIAAVDALMAEVLETQDAAVIRENNHAITGHLMDLETARRAGFTLLTGGGNETLNLFFDCDVIHPYRPGRRALEEDRKSDWILVPQMPVPGMIGEHSPIPADIPPEYRRGMSWGVWQDLSVPAIRRKFLLAYLESRTKREKIFTFGWTTHTNNLYGSDERAGDRRRTRDEIVDTVTWLNERFIGKEVRYASVDEVADAYRDWEKRFPDASSFHYPVRETRWDRAPFTLKALVRELMFSHHAEELPVGDGVQAHRFEKAQGRDWRFRDGKVVSATKTTEFFVVWSGRPTRVDLSKHLGATAIAIRGESGEEKRVETGSVEIGPEPILLKKEP